MSGLPTRKGSSFHKGERASVVVVYAMGLLIWLVLACAVPAIVLAVVLFFVSRARELNIEARLDASCTAAEQNVSSAQSSHRAESTEDGRSLLSDAPSPALDQPRVLIASIEHVVPSLSLSLTMGGLGKMLGVYARHPQRESNSQSPDPARPTYC